MSQPYADFTAEAPKDKQTPWQPARHPFGHDAWNHSQEAREHPEWYTTAHGTLDLETEKEILDKLEARSNEKRRTSKDKSKHEHPKTRGPTKEGSIGFGHTVHKPRTTARPVHRDLDNI